MLKIYKVKLNNGMNRIVVGDKALNAIKNIVVAYHEINNPYAIRENN